MTFNSLVFLQFFAAVLFLYWLCRNNLRARNILLLIASYVFYGWWDWKFLSLLLISTVLDYVLGIYIDSAPTQRRRKWLLAASMIGNLTILGTFKYYGFFVDSLRYLLTSFGLPFNFKTLEIVLPVGISFYTFQTMSYTIDIYRRDMKPTRSLINFAAYVAFFPQLVAGPIERASHLLPQFERTLTITKSMVEEGIWLCIWGMFKKVVLADNLAPLADMVYAQPNPTALGVILGTTAFALQIYCDFSGYSDIARGTAKILGFELMVNFNIPYASTSVREFWRRWHISLSTWLRDYLYISLGGNRRGTFRTYSNLITTMVLGGLWHGAAWHFVLWGLWQGGGLAAHRLATGDSKAVAKPSPLKTIVAWLSTMLFVLYGWLLFRAKSFDHVLTLTRALTDFTVPLWVQSYVVNLLFFGAPIVAMDIWHARRGELVTLQIASWQKALLQGLLILGTLLFWGRQQGSFIYFQF